MAGSANHAALFGEISTNCSPSLKLFKSGRFDISLAFELSFLHPLPFASCFYQEGPPMGEIPKDVPAEILQDVPSGRNTLGQDALSACQPPSPGGRLDVSPPSLRSRSSATGGRSSSLPAGPRGSVVRGGEPGGGRAAGGRTRRRRAVLLGGGAADTQCARRAGGALTAPETAAGQGGRRFGVEKSVNGNGTSSTSPGSKVVICGVVGIVPERESRLRRLQQSQVGRPEVEQAG